MAKRKVIWFNLSGSIVALSLEVGGDDVCGIIPAEYEAGARKDSDDRRLIPLS
jgi:hypothetical protein